MQLETRIGDAEKSRIVDVLNTNDWSFSNLALLANLDPKKDFRFSDFANLDLRGQDLRGFDFTGSDLRGCLIDDSTIIDETTIFFECDLDWVHEDRKPIHEKMFEVEAATNSQERRRLLSELCSQYTSPVHTRIYIRRLIEKTSSVDTFFDLLDFFEPENEVDRSVVSDVFIKLLLKSSRRNFRGGTEEYSSRSFTNFIERTSNSDNSFVSEQYQAYLQGTYELGRVSLNPSKYQVSDDLKRLISAFEVSQSYQESSEFTQPPSKPR